MGDTTGKAAVSAVPRGGVVGVRSDLGGDAAWMNTCGGPPWECWQRCTCGDALSRLDVSDTSSSRATALDVTASADGLAGLSPAGSSRQSRDLAAADCCFICVAVAVHSAADPLRRAWAIEVARVVGGDSDASSR
jgi:hypothetical protein